MNMRVRLSSWAGLILLAGCSTRPPEEVPIEKPDGGNGDVPINPMDRPVSVCLPGRTYCSGAMSSPFKVCWMSGGLECGERRVTLAAGVDGSDDGSAT